MRALTARQVIRILRDNGFVLSRQKGSHMIWHNPQTGISVPVPLHGSGKSIPQGTLRAIVKQSRIAPEKFK